MLIITDDDTGAIDCANRLLSAPCGFHAERTTGGRIGPRRGRGQLASERKPTCTRPVHSRMHKECGVGVEDIRSNEGLSEESVILEQKV
jgi:hypothetical protein